MKLKFTSPLLILTLSILITGLRMKSINTSLWSTVLMEYMIYNEESIREITVLKDTPIKRHQKICQTNCRSYWIYPLPESFA